MTLAKTTARHRQACRPATPLTDLSKSLSVASTTRTLAAAAGTGAVVSMAFASGAMAVPGGHNLPQVDINPLTEAVQQELSTNPEVIVPEIAWTADEVSAVAEEVVVEAPAETERESRDQEVSDDNYAEDTYYEDYGSAPANPSGSAVVDIAYRYLGVPYVYGGTTPAGFDCSGFTGYVYSQVGINLPRSASAQSGVGTRVSAAEAQPGDLLSWGYHSGIYLGDGLMIDSSTPGTSIAVRSIWGSPSYIRL